MSVYDPILIKQLYDSLAMDKNVVVTVQSKDKRKEQGQGTKIQDNI